MRGLGEEMEGEGLVLWRVGCRRTYMSEGCTGQDRLSFEMFSPCCRGGESRADGKGQTRPLTSCRPTRGYLCVMYIQT